MADNEGTPMVQVGRPTTTTTTLDQPSSSTPATPLPPTAYPQPEPPASEPAQPHPLLAEAGPSSGPSPKHPPHHPPNLPPPRLISTHLIANPTHSAHKAITSNFPHPNPLFRLLRRFKVKHSVIDGLTEDEMTKWEARGKELRERAGWKFEGEEGEGTVVGELFWKMYLSLLPTLERDPLSGLVPPDLLGSTTTMPLSVISLIPDIMQHYRDVIVRAEKEVFLATNYWQPSNSVNTISQALRDLSARVIKDGRPKVVVKVMYDRGSWEQLWNSHAPVSPKEWEPLDLPAMKDVEGLELEVINFHKVLLGTFHAKFLIVDRKVALINSNNIQDRPNLELMSHLEGPIVDAFYEIALHSWSNRLTPPLPCMTTPYQPPVDPSTGKTRYLFQDRNPYFDDIEILKAARAARILLRRQTRDIDEMKAAHHENAGDRLMEAVRKVVDQQRQTLADWKPGEEIEARAQVAMKELREFRDRWAMGMGSMGMGSRANSRGPSRGPSRRPSRDREMRLREDAKEGRAFTIAPSEADSSPTVTGDLPTKSKTFPLPETPRSGNTTPGATPAHVWDSRILGTLEPPVSDSHSVPARAATDSVGATPRHSSDLGHGGHGAKHVAFQPLETSGIDGTGMFLTDGGAVVESPNASTLHLPETIAERRESGMSGVEAGGVGLKSGGEQGEEEVRGRPRGRTLERTADNVGPTNVVLGADAPNGGPSTSDPLTNGEPLHPTATNARGEDLPFSALNPDEAGDQYEKVKKHVMLAMTDDEVAAPGTGTEEDGVRTPKKSLGFDADQPEGTGSRRMFQLSQKFNAGALSEAWATVEDSDELDSFRPHVVHAPHEPFPIAMCCRKPHGFPGHHDIRNPQNAAWLAGFRYAKKKVFVQTPTLNARPIVRAVKQACRRGVDVVLLLDLGFNDKGESIPFQGGTNEEVVDRLYKKLSKEKKEQFLKVYWYTGKDQVRPLNAVKKQRNCHIKFAAYDDEVMIIGNGNQDSQSWFHSQEVNVMIDSKQIIGEMMETLLSNQNTIQYGGVDSDGVWRDKDGRTLEDYGATAKGTFRGLSGFIAFAKTI